MDDIDGAATFPTYPAEHRRGRRDGYSHVSVDWMVKHLRFANIQWWAETHRGNVSTAIEQAAMALALGKCSYAVVWRAMNMPKTSGYHAVHDERYATGDLAYSLPYGFTSGPIGFALTYNRYMQLYGAKREHMAALTLAARRGAQLNPHAHLAGIPLTFDDYMGARMIADPMSLLDCDIPVDGAGAIVLARAERATALPHDPAYIAGFGQARFANRTVETLSGPTGPEGFEICRVTAETIGTSLWRSAGFGPSDVDGAMLYDGFAPDVYFWLEGMGFCDEGEAFEFIQNGRIEIDGEFPINTFGGNLSEGRLHGIGHWIEATLQVQARAGERQIKGAHNIAVATGLLGSGSGAVLSRSPRTR
ncbi:thiolase family protein [Rhodococcus koreensis]